MTARVAKLPKRVGPWVRDDGNGRWVRHVSAPDGTLAVATVRDDARWSAGRPGALSFRKSDEGLEGAFVAANHALRERGYLLEGPERPPAPKAGALDPARLRRFFAAFDQVLCRGDELLMEEVVRYVERLASAPKIPPAPTPAVGNVAAGQVVPFRRPS